MIELATFQVTELSGKEQTLRAVDYRRAERIQGGSMLHMSFGELLIQQTPDDIQTTFAALYAQYTNHATGSVAGADYTVTNAATDRTYDANATTTDELADVLGSLIADLQAAGIIQ